MKCLQCGTKLTKENKARSKLGAGLPYCKRCIDAYLQAKEIEKETKALAKRLMGDKDELDLSPEVIKALTPHERSLLKIMLEGEGYTQEEIEKGWRELGVE